MKDEQSGVKPAAAVRPLFITKQNSEAVTGENFRFWKSNYPHLVRHIGRKCAIVATELEQEVSRTDTKTSSLQLVATEADPAETVRQIVLRAGGRC